MIEIRSTTGAQAGEGLNRSARLELYRRMLRIRRFESTASRLYESGEIPGFVHISIGQEATAVGGCWPLDSSDRITSTHRGHGHCLAKGMAMQPMFAELFGKRGGACAGRGGSMHIADPELGILGANGIVGAGLPIAAGSGLASKVRHDDRVTVAFFGDGAVATGAFHEAVNLAAVWSLPVVFFCEDNGFAEFSRSSTQHPVPVAARAGAYGMEAVELNGNDVVAVATAMTDIVGRLRAGAGPVLVVAHTSRWHGHYEGDPQRYRTTDERDAMRANDPIAALRSALMDGPEDALADDVAAIEAAVEDELAKALEVARNDEDPAPAELFDFVYAPRVADSVRAAPFEEPIESGSDGEIWRMMDAIKAALAHELEDDEDVLLAGIDIGAGGNIFGLTRGLHDQWPERILDTPISETAILGSAVGAAMVGMRPVVELMYLDFLGVCFDQLLNQAAKLRYMTGGRAGIPLTLRTQFGAGRSSGSQHSQSLEALLAHIPGLTVVMPSTPADAYGLLRSAIQDPNPVVVIDHRLLYGMKGPVVERGHTVPIGRAAVRRAGTDVTVVSVSRMVHEALRAADELAGEGISVELVDLRGVNPLDVDTVLASVERTGRLVIAHEAVRDFGIGAEIAARIGEDAFWHLDAPIARVGAKFTPAPYAPSLEHEWLPDSSVISETIRRLSAV